MDSRAGSPSLGQANNQAELSLQELFGQFVRAGSTPTRPRLMDRKIPWDRWILWKGLRIRREMNSSGE